MKIHHLLHCHHFFHYCIDLTNSVKSVLENFESLSDSVKKDILLHRDSRLDGNKNKFILEATLTYVKSTDRFSGLKILLYWKLPAHNLINKWPTKLTSLTCIYLKSYVSPDNTDNVVGAPVVCFYRFILVFVYNHYYRKKNLL